MKMVIPTLDIRNSTPQSIPAIKYLAWPKKSIAAPRRTPVSDITPPTSTTETNTRQVQPKYRSIAPKRQLSLYSRLRSLLEQAGRLERGFKDITALFDEHIDSLVVNVPLATKDAAGRWITQKGRVSEIRSRLQLAEQDGRNSELDSSSSTRQLDKKELEKIDFCLNKLLDHSNGLAAVKPIVERLLHEGIVPSVEVLTRFLKLVIWDDQEAGSLSNTRLFCQNLLGRMHASDSYLFSLITTLQLKSGTPTADIVKLTSESMGAGGDPRSIDWIPQAFDAIMKAYRRDGDIKAVMRWYSAYLESRTYQRDLESYDRYKKKQVGVAEEKARLWPHITMLHAYQDARSYRRLNVRGAYRPHSDQVESVVRRIAEDNLAIPSEMYCHLIRTAVIGKNYTMARSLWNMAQAVQERSIGRERMKIDTYIVGFELIARDSTFMQDRQALRSLVKRLTDEYNLRSKRKYGSNISDASAATHRKLFKTISEAALRHGDFTLALWAVQQCETYQLGVDEQMVDLIARGVLGYSVRRSRGNTWTELVLGREAVISLHKSRTRGRSRIWRSIVRQRGIKLQHWNLISQRILSLSQPNAAIDRMIYLPLCRPLARLVKTTYPIDRRVANSVRGGSFDYRWWRDQTRAEEYKRSMRDLVEGMTELLRRCVQSQKVAGRNMIGAKGPDLVDVQRELGQLELYLMSK
jgi:hypothetical protein